MMKEKRKKIIHAPDKILVTGSNGFIGSKVVELLAAKGFNNIRCLVRHTSNLERLNIVIRKYPKINIEIYKGNLLNKTDCTEMVKNVKVIYHVAAGIGGSFASSYLNCVVTTRNLMDAALLNGHLKRFVNVGSFASYSNFRMNRRSLLDETADTVHEYKETANPYAFAKTEQDNIVIQYGKEKNLPYVIVRPGTVYGPGAREKLTTRVGNKTFGVLLHIGGRNQLPLTYIDNCAEAIILAGIVDNIDGEVFNIVDDEKITSRKFLKLYKKNAFRFKSFYVPFHIFYIFSSLWEKYAIKSNYQIPLKFNRRSTANFWKGNKYSNKKLHNLLGWKQRVPFSEASIKYFNYMKETNKEKKIC